MTSITTRPRAERRSTMMSGKKIKRVEGEIYVLRVFVFFLFRFWETPSRSLCFALLFSFGAAIVAGVVALSVGGLYLYFTRE
jgi:hypothetical protein